MDGVQCIEYLLSRCPKFAAHWEDHCAWWGEKAAGLMLDLAAFGQYVAQAIERDDDAELAAIGDVAESLMSSPDKQVHGAVILGFLDGLARRCRSEPERLPLERLVRHLGPAVLAACRGLDKNLGIRTPSFW